MKSQTIINQIIKEDACSIETAERLTKAMHREGILHPDLAVRFRLLCANFDILPQSWLDGNYNQLVLPYYHDPIKDPAGIPVMASAVSDAYRQFIGTK